MEKKVSDSITEQVHIVRSQYINGYGRLFGGQLMQWIDELAGVVARRHADHEVTTASIDTIEFKKPAFSNDLIVMIGKVTFVGRTSMEVRVDSYVEAYGAERSLINTAYVVMVAIDAEGNPIVLPKLIPETEEECSDWEDGEKRYTLRKERRKAGY